ncbi:hypothetical protein ADK41_07060 [Streptomyces caelestis]|uniref:Uncharacterized protein n=2 Tax=Streptomyces TaxID=1883 RepID=A0A0M8QUK2_9ACTN|nr:MULTISPECIES: hypothetical protein [Streptomyces]KOT42583.1 hypothetical protein ADK41_07060 [Streptomyces caelestis]KOV29941.1 hypothetical protein ADK58_08625 [Streptomyces sp. XY152]
MTTDGALVPVRDRAGEVPSRTYRFPVNPRVVVDAEPRPEWASSGSATTGSSAPAVRAHSDLRTPAHLLTDAGLRRGRPARCPA